MFLQLHGRSREQRYTKLADWDYISTCSKLASPVPLFGKVFLTLAVLGNNSKVKNVDYLAVKWENFHNPTCMIVNRN